MIVGNFLEDLNVRLVDSFSLWNPLGVNFILENSLGWSNGFSVSVDITSSFFMKIFISLSSSSPVVGNFNGIVELDMGWGSGGSWGEFGLSNLVVPGSGVHVLNSLSSFLPLSSVSLKGFSGIVGVLHVSSKIIFDLVIEFVSLVQVFINLTSDFLS